MTIKVWLYLSHPNNEPLAIRHWLYHPLCKEVWVEKKNLVIVDDAIPASAILY